LFTHIHTHTHTHTHTHIYIYIYIYISMLNEVVGVQAHWDVPAEDKWTVIFDDIQFRLVGPRTCCSTLFGEF
jgi:hypothetical protein